MGGPDNRPDVERLKEIPIDGWNKILSKSPDERAYAFGLYTNEMGQYMYPFLLGEQGLEQVAMAYAAKGLYALNEAREHLRWSTADSPYTSALAEKICDFNGRPDVYSLSEAGAAREVRYRLTAACAALQELDADGMFGAAPEREGITLYIEGGDVNREWLLKWAKKVNPRTVYDRFAGIGAPQDTSGKFTEFGTKKVYQTKSYAQSADKKLIAAATSYHLFVFDTVGLKQLFSRSLPTKQDYAPLGSVSMSGDGKLIVVIPFGSGSHGKEFFIVTGAKGSDVKTVPLAELPSAIAVSPTGDWIAITDQAGALNVYEPTGELRVSQTGHGYWPRGIAVSSDGSRLATADSKSVILWNTADWSKVWSRDATIDCVDFDPRGGVLAGCCRYPPHGITPRSITTFDVDTGATGDEIFIEGRRIDHLRFSPDGRRLACAVRMDREEYAGTDTAVVVDVETGRVQDRLKADFEQICDFAFLPHRGEIAVAVFGHTRRPLVLWQAK